MPDRSNEMANRRSWSFLTNHARLLICIAGAPESRVRDLAARVGITERGVHRIVAELESEGYLSVARVGRRNRYAVNTGLPLREELVPDRTVADLLAPGSAEKSAE